MVFRGRLTGSACQCVTVVSSSDSDKGRRSGRREACQVLSARALADPSKNIYIYMYICVRRSRFFESQKQVQKDLFLSVKNNIC